MFYLLDFDSNQCQRHVWRIRNVPLSLKLLVIEKEQIDKVYIVYEEDIKACVQGQSEVDLNWNKPDPGGSTCTSGLIPGVNRF